MSTATSKADGNVGFQAGLGTFDSTMMVAGSMIGSGIYIVSADMSRLLGSPGWLLLAWLLTGLLTVTGALSYGELAGMMPKAGGQYVYLRESFSPMWGFLYGWTLLLVIQTGTIAAVGVAFGRFLGILWPAIGERTYLIEPVHITTGFALSLSTAQLVGVLVIAFLTWTNCQGLRYGKWIQNVFTTAKLGTMAALILIGIFRYPVLMSVLQFKRVAKTRSLSGDSFRTSLQEDVHPLFVRQGDVEEAVAVDVAAGELGADAGVVAGGDGVFGELRAVF